MNISRGPELSSIFTDPGLYVVPFLLVSFQSSHIWLSSVIEMARCSSAITLFGIPSRGSALKATPSSYRIKCRWLTKTDRYPCRRNLGRSPNGVRGEQSPPPSFCKPSINFISRLNLRLGAAIGSLASFMCYIYRNFECAYTSVFARHSISSYEIEYWFTILSWLLVVGDLAYSKLMKLCCIYTSLNG